MTGIGTTKRDPNRARSVLVHPELHRELAREAREQGFTIQGRLHDLLCDQFGRPDLKEREAAAVAS